MITLQNEKDQAIENEDYDLAKQIKGQIEQVKYFAYQIGEPVQQDH
jgi:hypothetical protein